MRALVLLLMAVLAWSGAALADGPSHGLSLYGELKYPPDFKHFDYVNPDAPKGGTVKYDAIGTFDTLNPFTLKGQPAAGSLAIFDTLLAAAPDEPVAAYGLIAESVEVAPDHKSVLYTLRKEARFHDGTPITPEDVVWTFDTLKTKGHPRYRLYYADVVKAETDGERGVRFTFKSGDNHELPQIVGEMPVLPKKYWETRDFEKTTLDPPLGSGPYKIDTVDPGRAITLRRVPDYWGKDLPVNVGRYNFDVIRFDYYRDQTIALEAFKAGQYDIRVENVAKNWAIGYDSPALAAGPDQEGRDPEQAAGGHAGLRLQHAPRPPVPGRARAPGAGLSVRFRMDQQEPVLRRLYPHRELFLEFRSRLVGHAAGRRADDPRALQGRDPGRASSPRPIDAAQDRRQRQYPRQSARGAAALRGGGMDGEERAARQWRRQAIRLRVPAGAARVRAHRPALRAESRARRHQDERAHWSIRRNTRTACASSIST